MFEVEYRIANSEYDEYIGQNGFLKIRCNNCSYGEIYPKEIYPKEIEEFMDKVSLFDWFYRLIKVVEYLETKEYVALSDVESYNTWIVFKRINENVEISVVKAKKKDNSRDIEFELEEISDGDCGKQIVVYKQFLNEILMKTNEYIKFITEKNIDDINVNKVRQSFEKFYEKFSNFGIVSSEL